METPIAFFIFKRPDTTRQVFETIRQVKPKQLFVIADGPRIDKPEEVALCKAARDIVSEIDWDCDLEKNYSDMNFGLKKRFQSGLDWVFECVDRCIILEDDCLPDLSFFRFCAELLDKYENNENIFSITGHNHLGEWQSSRSSYFCAKYFDCWGWATWRRVWQQFDPDMELWGKEKVRQQIQNFISNEEQFMNRSRVLDMAYRGEVNSWAYPFFFMCLQHSGLTITPSVNLIKNIGFGENSTNTKNINDIRAKAEIFELDFPLVHPQQVEVDKEYDDLRYKKVWKRTSKKRLISFLRKLKSILN